MGRRFRCGRVHDVIGGGGPSLPTPLSRSFVFSFLTSFLLLFFSHFFSFSFSFLFFFFWSTGFHPLAPGVNLVLIFHSFPIFFSFFFLIFVKAKGAFPFVPSFTVFKFSVVSLPSFS